MGIGQAGRGCAVLLHSRCWGAFASLEQAAGSSTLQRRTQGQAGSHGAWGSPTEVPNPSMVAPREQPFPSPKPSLAALKHTLHASPIFLSPWRRIGLFPTPVATCIDPQHHFRVLSWARLAHPAFSSKEQEPGGDGHVLRGSQHLLVLPSLRPRRLPTSPQRRRGPVEAAVKVTAGRPPPRGTAPVHPPPATAHRRGGGPHRGPVRSRLAVGGEAGNGGAAAGLQRRARSPERARRSILRAPRPRCGPLPPQHPGLLWAVPASRPPHARPARR